MATLVIFFACLFLPFFKSQAELVKRNDDRYYITGKGCGLTNTIHHLQELPKNIENNECSVISLKKVEMEMAAGRYLIGIITLSSLVFDCEC